MKSSPMLSIMAGTLLSSCVLFQWAMAGATLSDANVLAMLDTINLNEIDAAGLAKQKTASAEVRTFASHMMNEHAAMTQDLRQLVYRLNVQPETPASASTTGRAHTEMMDNLRKKSGSDFDQAYLKYQITMHEQAINFVQDTASSVQDRRLQQYLRHTHPELEGHLSVARLIERQLVAQSGAGKGLRERDAA